MHSFTKIAFTLVLVSAAVACGGGSSSAPAPATPTPAPAASPATAPAASSTAPLKAPGEATIGDRTTCPTSGEQFTVTASSPKYEYKGKTYYFCCGGCDQKFAKDPEKFLQKKPEA